MDNKVIIGRFGSVHGVKGDIRVFLYTDPPELALECLPWQVEIKGEWQPLIIEKTKWHSDQLLIHIENIDDRDIAKRYTNLNIGINRKQLPELEKGEYYWLELVGLTVIDQNNHELGKIEYFEATGSNDVFVVKGETEYCLPYLDDVVKEIDLEAGIMKVEWEEPGES